MVTGPADEWIPGGGHPRSHEPASGGAPPDRPELSSGGGWRAHQQHRPLADRAAIAGASWSPRRRYGHGGLECAFFNASPRRGAAPAGSTASADDEGRVVERGGTSASGDEPGAPFGGGTEAGGGVGSTDPGGRAALSRAPKFLERL